MIRSLRNLLRLFHVARILARHDALFVPSDAGWLALPMAVARLLDRRREPGRPGQRLARALEEAGPTFIKLGQALSCRADLIGEEMAADLSDLQDRLPPFDGAAARRIIEEDLGQPVEALFSHLDPQPVAAASIAQVHLAETTDGRAVAVKVLRPGVKQAVARDLELFLWVAEVLEATVPEARRLKPVQTVQTFADTVTFEMDLSVRPSSRLALSRRRSLPRPLAPSSCRCSATAFSTPICMPATFSFKRMVRWRRSTLASSVESTCATAVFSANC